MVFIRLLQIQLDGLLFFCVALYKRISGTIGGSYHIINKDMDHQ